MRLFIVLKYLAGRELYDFHVNITGAVKYINMDLRKVLRWFRSFICDGYCSKYYQPIINELRDRKAKLELDLQRATEEIEKAQKELEQCFACKRELEVRLCSCLEEKKSLEDRVKELEHKIKLLEDDVEYYEKELGKLQAILKGEVLRVPAFHEIIGDIPTKTVEIPCGPLEEIIKTDEWKRGTRDMIFRCDVDRADMQYLVMTKTKWEKFLKVVNEPVEKLAYKQPIFDCDDYALLLAGMVVYSVQKSRQLMDKQLAFGICWSPVHAFNCFVTSDERIFLWEPQASYSPVELTKDWWVNQYRLATGGQPYSVYWAVQFWFMG